MNLRPWYHQLPPRRRQGTWYFGVAMAAFAAALLSIRVAPFQAAWVVIPASLVVTVFGLVGIAMILFGGQSGPARGAGDAVSSPPEDYRQRTDGPLS